MISNLIFKLRHILVLLLFSICFFGARQLAAYAYYSDNPHYTIVIDPGHGGADPGKVAVNGALEKDINLAIAIKLQEFFEKKGHTVIMTRSSDTDLSTKDAANHKSEDLNNRVNLMSQKDVDLAISVHQNSYTDESAYGPETFYYCNSSESEELANCIQSSIISALCITDTRGTTSNDNYFILKKSPTPTVIVECGFLSNYSEAQLLCDEEYQYRIARSIYMGACDYLSSQ